MGKNLVIVESPAKARTIHKYLGKDFEVKASMGHVRDLPKGELGIDVEHDFQPKYRVIQQRSKTVQELKRSAKKADAVFLAPDPDREGEAIAWHLVEALGLPEEKVFRITFNEITKRAVREALENPGKIRRSLVDAQQARRILDRLVGYKLSPLLWEKVARGLSAGRVQSVAVRLVVEREREIRAFEPKEYWKVTAYLSRTDAFRNEEPPRREDGTPDTSHPDLFSAELKRCDGKAIELADEEQARRAVEEAKGETFRVAKVEKRRKLLKAPPPFTTSLLQQIASNRLGFSAKKTMRVAQQLYEGLDVGSEEGPVGLITYMRTDSFRLADEAVAGIRELVKERFGERYLPAKPNVFRARKGAQEAHEAIRPTDVRRTPEQLKKHLTRDQFRLYELIWRRTVACQMAPAEFDQTSVTVRAGRLEFGARGRRLVFEGHLRLGELERAKGEQDLPELEEGMELSLHDLLPTQHFTQPPPRYTEATLVKTLEKKGIGRPSTYATILSTIQDRGYVRLVDRKFHATELGEIVTDQLVRHFPDIFDYDFTAEMESQLDEIEAEKADWLRTVRGFYDAFERDLRRAFESMENLKVRPDPEGRTCPDCGREMLLRLNRFGTFLGCSGYPECKTVLRLSSEGEALERRPEPKETGETCEKCGKPMVLREGKRGPFVSCSGWPKCRNSYSVDEEGRPIRPQVVEETCPKCGGDKMVVRIARRGRNRGPFLGCARYPKCRGTKPLPEGLEVALPAGSSAEPPSRAEGEEKDEG